MSRPLLATLLAPLLAAALSACSGSSGSTLCDGVTGPCTAIDAGLSEEQIQAKLAAVATGSTVVFDAGTFHFKNALAFDASSLTVQGAGASSTILDFGAQVAGGAGGEGLSFSGDQLYVHDLGVQDPAGNGIKISGATGVHIARVRVAWSNGGASTNGPYGLYPVACTDVLIEDSYAEGASDTGIYVGQSTNIVVRNNEATGNVMGVEIENCHGAEVTGNHLHGNTGGVLVFTGPNLAQKDGNTAHVHHNLIEDNGRANFGYGGMVATIPAGSGVVVMANRDVEIDNNTITGHRTVGVGIVSFNFTGLAASTAPDPAYYTYPRRVFVHDNTFAGNGTSPDVALPLGQLLASIWGTPDAPFPTALPDVLYDGVLDPAVTAPAGFEGNPMQVCLGTAATGFANLTQDQNWQPDLGIYYPLSPSTAAAAYACTLPALAAITLP